jgi:hypothetical protein
VKIVVTGGGEFRSVHIAPAAVDPEDVELLEEMVLAALADATSQIRELQEGAVGEGVDLGGLDDMLGGLGLGGLLGGSRGELPGPD